MRHVTRNVKRWRDGAMIRRWVGLGLGRAATRFRRISCRRLDAACAITTPKGNPAIGCWNSMPRSIVIKTS